jgi:hypothetical protein
MRNAPEVRRLLLPVLDRNKAYPGTRHRFADRLSVDCVLLAALDIGLNIRKVVRSLPDRRPGSPARPIAQAGARLEPDPGQCAQPDRATGPG